jgi:hypothetical protein
MRWASRRERRLWRAVAALVAAIYASAYFVQFALDFLRAQNLLRLAIGAGFAAVAVAVGGWLVRSGARLRAWGAVALVAAVYAGAALALPIVQERVHLLEYGALALLAREALRARAAADPACGFRSTRAAACGAFALASLAGAGDEVVQAILPNRVGELRDSALNALSAGLALAAASAVEGALARDRRARGGAP